ncbi:MAG: hypothetical protein H0V82_01740 [Candidatus Protochlamydia sp.]|nr:hypothetical protein [Candidatus Protochlamydia sp.]
MQNFKIFPRPFPDYAYVFENFEWLNPNEKLSIFDESEHFQKVFSDIENILCKIFNNYQNAQKNPLHHNGWYLAAKPFSEAKEDISQPIAQELSKGFFKKLNCVSSLHLPMQNMIKTQTTPFIEINLPADIAEKPNLTYFLTIEIVKEKGSLTLENLRSATHFEKLILSHLFIKLGDRKIFADMTEQEIKWAALLLGINRVRAVNQIIGVEVSALQFKKFDLIKEYFSSDFRRVDEQNSMMTELALKILKEALEILEIKIENVEKRSEQINSIVLGGSKKA